MRLALAAALFATVAAPSFHAAVARPASDTAGFFDDFNRLDLQRWFISDGWTNGAHQNCLWTRNNMQLRKGVLELKFTRERNSVREFRCPEIRTRAALGYGVYEARIRAAKGSGLNTAMFTYSGRPLTPVHDELDFEILGRDTSGVHSNYFANGSGENVRTLAVGNDASAGFNNYAIEWRPGSIKWYINGRLLRTASGPRLPTTPGQYFLSLWGGSPEWMGSLDRSAVPAVAAVDWVAYTPLNRRCLFAQSITCAPAR